jgi:hypothetical protein
MKEMKQKKEREKKEEKTIEIGELFDVSLYEEQRNPTHCLPFMYMFIY